MADTSKFRQGENEYGMKDTYARQELEKKISSPMIAKVGQTIVVDAVDVNGCPTAWRASDPPSTGFRHVETVVTAEEVGWLALNIPEAAVEAALYVVVAASDSLTSNIRADAWKKAAPTKGGCEVTLGNAGTSAKKYLARAAKYGDKIRNEQVFYMPYPTNAQVAHSGSDLHDPEGPYYIVSTPYGTSMIPIGTTISLFVR